MTQPDQTLRNEYPANGSTVEFVYEFKINDKTQIDVNLIQVVDGVIENTPQVLDVDYNVQGVGNDIGGTVTFIIDAPESPLTVVLQMEVPFTQDSVFVAGTAFPSVTIESAYDKLTRIAQQNRREIKASLQPPDLPGFTDGVLQVTGNGILAGNILQINATLDGFMSNPLEVVFGLGPLTAHQITQLGQIGETTFISAGEWGFLSTMDQNVSTTSAVTFSSVNGATNLSDIAGLTTNEIDQIKNIDSTVITTANWSYLPSLDQDLGTSDSPEFAGITIDGEDVGSTVIHANQNLKTGAIVNGVMSIASATQFNVTAGSGIFVDYFTDVLNPVVIEVSWSAFSNVTLLNMGVGVFKGIAIDSAGLIVQTNDAFSELELRDLIPLGTIVHNATDIIFTANITRKSIGIPDIIYDLSETIGSLNKSGNIYSANGANLSIDKTSGETFGAGINNNNSEKFSNITTDPAAILTSMTPIHRDGSGGFVFLPSVTVIDPGNYDDGSGTLQSLGVNQATNHRIAYDASIQATFFLYGQTQYANIGDATLAVPDAFDVVNVATSQLTVRAIISARGAATDLTNTGDALITEVTRFGSSGGSTTAIQAASLQTAYDQSETVVLAAATPISVEVDTDTDKAISYKDSSSTETYSITGDGNVDQSGTLHLQGITNATEQFIVTANASQGSNPLGTFRDNSLDPIQRVLESSTEFDKPVNINGTDDTAASLNVKGSPTPSGFVFSVSDNALNPLISVDNNGEFLVKGEELESGSGETVVGFAEFTSSSTAGQFAITLPTFGDPDTTGLRIEIRGIKLSTLGNPPGSISQPIGMVFSTFTNQKSDTTNYYGTNVTNGVSHIHSTTESIGPLSGDFTPLGPLFNDGGIIRAVETQELTSTIIIPALSDVLGDRMIFHISGSATVPVVPGFEQESMFVFSSTEVIGPRLNDPMVDETNEVVRGFKIFSHSPLRPFTAGSIKIIAIKSGGPAIPLNPL